MINAVLNAKSVKDVVSVIKELMMDVNITFDHNLILMSGVDPEHVAIIEWKIESETIQGEFMAVGLFMTAVYKFLRFAESDDDLILTADDQRGIQFRIKNEKTGRDLGYYFYNSCLPYTPSPPLRRDHYDGHVSLKTSYLYKSLRDISYTSKVVSLFIDKHGDITFNTKGENGMGTVTLRETQDRVTWIYRHFDVYHQSFYLNYLDRFIRGNVSEYIQFKFDTTMLYIISERGEQTLTMALAPFQVQV